MKKLIILAIFLCAKNIFASDTTAFSCKYRFIKQKDSTNTSSKFDDIMILSLGKSNSIYYSYLRHFGKKRMIDDLNGNSNTSLDVNSGDVNKYYPQNESEIIGINYKQKKINVSDELIATCYEYSDTLIAPIWKIENETQLILKQKCQKAYCNFKGRNYTAWFANSIPIAMGPWLFNGLPGLILKVEDDKKQFYFECIELNTTSQSTSVFKPYTNTKIISKEKLKLKRKLLAQDITEFIKSETGGTFTRVSGGNGAVIKREKKPYNPIELTQ